MLKDNLVNRYVDALIEVVPEQHYERSLNELLMFAGLLNELPSLYSVMVSPGVSFEQKSNVLKALLQKADFIKEVLGLLTVLIKNERLELLAAFIEKYRQQVYVKIKKAEVAVTVALEISPALKEQLNDFFVKLTGCQVDLTVKQDEELLAGLVANINGRIIDSSLKGQIKKLEKQLLI